MIEHPLMKYFQSRMTNSIKYEHDFPREAPCFALTQTLKILKKIRVIYIASIYKPAFYDLWWHVRSSFATLSYKPPFLSQI